MKKLLLIALLSLSLLDASAKHIKGGFFTYQYEGLGINNPTYLRYKITLTIYMLCDVTIGPDQQLTPSVDFTIFDGRGDTYIASPTVYFTSRDTFQLSKLVADPCINGNISELTGCYYTVVTYVLDNYELPVTQDGYVISLQRCCRISQMDNVENSENTGNTYTIAIPGTSSTVPDANKNSSPVFPINDTILVCANNYFEFSFKATDLDGDSLAYTLCSAYSGASPADAQPPIAANPPYGIVVYTPGFSGSQPMGPQVTIDPVTGLLSGVSPPIGLSGEYVVTVCVAEYRNGIHFADSRKELHVRVKDCTPLRAAILIPPYKLSPEYSICNGYTLNFTNGFANPSGTDYVWDFGDPGSGASNTSTSPTPSHLYSDTGVYKVKLKASLGGLCSDSTTAEVKIYPGFFAGFKTLPPFCKGVPVQFEDTTKTTYGSVTGWRWDFGNTLVTNDTTHIEDPSYAYTKPGTYHVQFEVANTKGCTDTVYTDIIIADNPALSLTPHDTTYCALDTLQLTATGTGNFSWAPSLKISGANTATPLVYPATTTKYLVTLSNGGCISTDSATLHPLNDLSTTIVASVNQVCEEDTLTLTGSSNHNPVTWQWNPAKFVATPQAQVTKAFPAATTNYILAATWGNHCVASATKTINVIPLAIPVISPDIPFCAGQGSEQLMASGGDNYQWSPLSYLNNTSISDPVATPPATTQYTVSVGVNGCTKRRNATVIVGVRTLPSLKLTDDTLICSIDTLQLAATGNGSVIWAPNYSINNLTSSTPLVSPDIPTTYSARLTDAFGCYTDASVFVDVRTFIAVNAGNDTTICQTDSIILHPVSDALHYVWSPSVYLNSPTIKNPVATPLNSQSYHVIANLGKCQAQDDINIRVVPYPDANAGKDTSICFGISVQLHGSGGSIYEWAPSSFLTATNIPDPVSVIPLGTVPYILTVRDTLGCPKATSDTVLISVFPEPVANAGPRDTSIVTGEPVQLNGTGGDLYKWSPPTWLNNPNIANPVSLPQGNIQYVLLVTTTAGCKSSDTINIKLFNVDPSLYVPTAFTPNNDGLNDKFKPVLLGMKKLNYFRVYNRWGELVYSSSVIGEGWDGSYKGQPQNSGAYVWMAEGVNYKNEIIKKQGTVVLIR